MESTSELLDLVIGALQIISILFLIYGAYLATRKAGELQISDAPTLTSAAFPKRSASTAEPGGAWEPDLR